MKVLFGSFGGAGRVLNFYKGSRVGPDIVVGVDVADAFHQVIDVLDAFVFKGTVSRLCAPASVISFFFKRQ